IDENNLRGKFLYTIYNVRGEIEKSGIEFISEGAFRKQIDLTELFSGLYILKIEFGNTTITDKIIKK
ncbi:MAG: T9SS type A sorting domain-containing protein, partial [bacterium]|nr:T9SS type A sorting domain-containing protein [bacterium]